MSIKDINKQGNDNAESNCKLEITIDTRHFTAGLASFLWSLYFLDGATFGESQEGFEAWKEKPVVLG